MTGLHNLKKEFLYRALRTDEDPYTDIVCKDPDSDRTIDEHVKRGLHFPSKYISTTAEFTSAQTWIETSVRLSKYKRGTTIIKIDLNYLKNNCPDLVNSAYNFTDSTVRLTTLNDFSRRYARKYEEVVFERLIPSQAICDIHVEGKGWIGTQPPRSVPTPIPTPATLPIPTPISTTPLSLSTHSLLSTSISPTSEAVRSTVEYNDDTSSLNTTISSSISSPSVICVSDISNYSIPSLDTSADTSDTITPLKISTGVKRSFDIDSELTPAKYVRVDIEGILSADKKQNYVTPSTSEDVHPEDTIPEEVSDSTVSINE